MPILKPKILLRTTGATTASVNRNETSVAHSPGRQDRIYRGREPAHPIASLCFLEMDQKAADHYLSGRELRLESTCAAFGQFSKRHGGVLAATKLELENKSDLVLVV